MTQPRSDLLELVRRYDRRRRRSIARVERWRRREIPAGQVVARAERLAGEMAAAGLGTGDRIGLLLNDGPLWHVAFLAILRIGGIAVPLDVSLDVELIRNRVRELELAGWCTEREAPELEVPGDSFELSWRPGGGNGAGRPAAGPGRRGDGGPEALPLPEDDADGVAEIVLTSGTSGTPTAVPIRHRNLRAVLDALAGEIEPYRRLLRLTPPLHLAVALPLSHLYGQMMGLFVPILLDADVSQMDTLPAHELARGLRERGAWVLATVPRTLDRLAEHLRAVGEERWGRRGMAERLREVRGRHWIRRWVAFASLRRRLGRRLIAVLSGGAPLDAGTEDVFRTLGYVVVQGYGLTETAPLVTLQHPFDARRRALGRPLPGVEVGLADDGEILVRGDNVATSRLGGPAVDVEGWLHTGDLGSFDEEGRLRFEGRKGERIVTPAGVNVDPEPVAARLRRQPGIRDAVVLERPWGDPGVICAVLVVGPGGDAEAAVAEVNEDLPDAARIRAWHRWPGTDLPRTPTDKPRRAEIRRWLEERVPDGAGEGEGEGPGDGREADGDERHLPSDPYHAVARAVAEVTDARIPDLGPGTRIGDITTSLDRVELAALLESDFGVALPAAAFGGDPTLGEIAGSLGRGSAPGATAGTADPGSGSWRGDLGEVGDAGDNAGATTAAAPGDGGPPPGAREGRIPAHRGTATRGEDTGVPGAAWRSLAPVRALRFLLREGIVRPLWFLLFDLVVEGRRHADSLEPPFLVGANHLSVLDPGAVLFGLDARRRGKIAPAARWEYFTGATAGRLQYRLGVLGLDLIPLVQTGDWRPTLRIAGRVADRGGCPLVFPEGERTTSGELLDFQLGIGVMARELHLPILPCAIQGLMSVLPRGARWPRDCWLGRAPVTVRFGRALEPPRPGDAVEPVVSELRGRIAGLLEGGGSTVR